MLFTGVSNGVVLTCVVAAIARYFSRYLFLASTVSLIGAGIGVLIYGPILQWLFEYYGWRGATLILSGLSLNYCTSGFTILPKKNLLNLKPIQRSNQDGALLPQELQPLDDGFKNTCNTHRELLDTTIHSNENAENGSLKTNDNSSSIHVMNDEDGELHRFKDVVLNVNFWLLSYSVFTWGFGSLTFTGVYKDLLHSIGLEDYFKQFIVGFGAANVLARTVITLLSFNYIVLYHAIILFMGGVFIILFGFIFEVWSMATVSCFMGFCFGATYSMIPISVGSVYGRKKMGTVYGYVLASIGIPSTFVPSVIGEYEFPLRPFF